MSAFNIALAFVTLINLLYVLVGAHLLNQTLKNSDTSKRELLRAAQQNMETGQALGHAARRTITEMERIYSNHFETDRSLGREVHELGRQVQLLSQQLQNQHPKDGGEARSAQEDERIERDLRAKLRADLNTALAQNHQLQDELDQAQTRLTAAASSQRALQTEVKDSKDYSRSVVESLQRQLKELEEALVQAQQRAKKAEKHAEENAVLLDEVRLQLHAQWDRSDAQARTRPATPPEQASAELPDQSGLIESQQQEIDALAEREKRLMQRINELEDSIQRTQAEKTFIEDRFMQIDAQLSPQPPKTA